MKAWSPDGQWLAGHGVRDGNRDIFVVRADGTDHQTVHESSTPERYPDWSPDGRSLVFYASLEEGVVLFTSDRVGDSSWSEPRRLTAGGGARWSPDSDRIGFTSGGSAWVIDRDGGPPGRIFEGGAETVFWTSLRELIVLDRIPDGTTALREISLDGAPARTLVLFHDLLRPPRPEFVVYDGRIYYTFAELEGDLWAMDLEW